MARRLQRLYRAREVHLLLATTPRAIELIYLDYGDLGAVYGIDPESDQELSPEASLITKARIWLYSRRRGYLPIQDRRAELLRYLAEAHGLSNIRPRNA